MTTAEKLSKVYVGVEKTEALNAELEQALYGTNEGVKSFYDEFWDAYQQNGQRGAWANAFYNIGWDDISYNPKYPIKGGRGENCYAMFGYSAITDTKVDIDMSMAGQTGSFFVSCFYLKTIRHIKIHENETFTSWFTNCNALENITFDGTIAQNGLNLQWSTKLSRASIENIIGCLSPNTTGLTVTLSKTAKEAAFTADEWDALIATKTNWTISLV